MSETRVALLASLLASGLILALWVAFIFLCTLTVRCAWSF